MRANLIGRHVRPWMENARLHGHDVTAIDGFNDWDSALFGTLLQYPGDPMGESPGDFFKRFEDLPEGPVFFCSPMETCHQVLEHASSRRRVLNAAPKSVAACRDPRFLELMSGGGVRFPDSFFEAGGGAKGWIVKSRFSAGGLGIRKDDGVLLPGEYRQKIVEGKSTGAVFFTSGGATSLAGLVRHINHGFLHGGGIYPASVAEDIRTAIAAFGAKIAAATGLSGWWGADFIIGDEIFVLEVNPRFTASLELVAKVHGMDILKTQAAAFDDICHIEIGRHDGYFGAMVVYAERDGVFKNPEKWFEAGARDIPHHGQPFRKGEPVLSVYASGSSAEDCFAGLSRQAGELREGF